MSLTIQGLSVSTPQWSMDQSTLSRLMGARYTTDTDQQRSMSVLFRRSGVKLRFSSLFNEELFNDFYPLDNNPTTAQRMDRYQIDALPFATSTACMALERAGLRAGQIDHLVMASCTGFAAPGVDVGLIESLGLSRSISRTNVGFMGCHGAFNALRVAGGLIAGDAQSKVLMVAVEMCGIHLQYGWDPQQVVSGALFADGCGAAVCSADAKLGHWKILAHGSYVLPNSRDAMTWRIGDHGFVMTLSPQVPDLIRSSLGRWLSEWLARRDLRINDIKNWAIHPGGIRILSAAAEAIGLPEEALSASRKVLETKGNMSSPTILFILDELANSDARGLTVALGFGPGLTIEAMLLSGD